MELIVKLLGVSILTLVAPLLSLVVIFLGISDAFEDACAIATGGQARGNKLRGFVDLTIKSLGLT